MSIAPSPISEIRLDKREQLILLLRSMGCIIYYFPNGWLFMRLPVCNTIKFLNFELYSKQFNTKLLLIKLLQKED